MKPKTHSLLTKNGGRARELILASGSPRRRELLKSAGFKYSVLVPDADESVAPGARPAAACAAIARRKARLAAELLLQRPSWRSNANKTGAKKTALVLAADTMVYCGGELLGKANGEREARRILNKLSGARHEVLTGVCLKQIPEMTERVFVVKTQLEMRRWLPREIREYIQSGEWIGKAGAYAIQETADRFVTEMKGSLTNVVGLPMERVGKELLKLGIQPKK